MKGISFLVSFLAATSVFAAPATTPTNKTLAACLEMSKEVAKALVTVTAPKTEVDNTAMCMDIVGLGYYLMMNEAKYVGGKAGNPEFTADVKACANKANASLFVKMVTLNTKASCPQVYAKYPVLRQEPNVLAFLGM